MKNARLAGVAVWGAALAGCSAGSGTEVPFYQDRANRIALVTGWRSDGTHFEDGFAPPRRRRISLEAAAETVAGDWPHVAFEPRPLDLDTGADNTIFFMSDEEFHKLPKDLTSALKPHHAQVVGGRTITHYELPPCKVTVGGVSARLDSISIVIYNNEVFSFMQRYHSSEGLLGNDFISQFKMTVDYANQVVTFAPR